MQDFSKCLGLFEVIMANPVTNNQQLVGLETRRRTNTSPPWSCSCNVTMPTFDFWGELNWMGGLEISILPFPNIMDTTRMIDECDVPFIHLLCLLNDFQHLPKRCKAGKRWWNDQDAMLDRHIPRSCSKCGSCRRLIDEYRHFLHLFVL